MGPSLTGMSMTLCRPLWCFITMKPISTLKLPLNHSVMVDAFLYGEQGKQFLKQMTVPVEAIVRSPAGRGGR